MPFTVAVATKHGKLAQIAPAFEGMREWRLELAQIDTDDFGTFSGEVERRLSPRETAIEKAKAGARFLGVDYGIASEGTIGAHPHLPFINSDYELMAFVCLDRNLEIVESFLSADIVAHHQEVTRTTDIGDLIRTLDLPNHATNIVVETTLGREVHKGVRDVDVARKTIEQLMENDENKIRVESDFRAMYSPSRQQNIERCAERLAARVAATCPACSHFGWGKTGYEYGLPCTTCGRLNANVARAEKLGCLSCDFTDINHLGREAIDPGRCELCNP